MGMVIKKSEDGEDDKNCNAWRHSFTIKLVFNDFNLILYILSKKNLIQDGGEY